MILYMGDPLVKGKQFIKEEVEGLRVLTYKKPTKTGYEFINENDETITLTKEETLQLKEDMSILKDGEGPYTYQKTTLSSIISGINSANKGFKVKKSESWNARQNLKQYSVVTPDGEVGKLMILVIKDVNNNYKIIEYKISKLREPIATVKAATDTDYVRLAELIANKFGIGGKTDEK